MRYVLAFLAAVWLVQIPGIAPADEIRTDVNIVTGLDVSGSIEAKETQIQIDGLAMAIRSPEVIAAIRSGRHGRVGFAVFVWANGNLPVFAEWRQIASAEDALALSEELSLRLHAILESTAALKLGELTDLSGAIAFGGAMLLAAPYPTDHAILNIMGNGLDNVAEGPERARNILVAQGVTINGVVIGHDRGVIGYFRRNVIGGPAAFVLPAGEPQTLVDVFKRKFVTEIVWNAGRAEDGAAQPLR
ncbi:MAG TPA: DUF1194 domain-containing protein [Alphaproteobacteria bacterium]|nr:DUF1194 domain-containing protein [Alphaproteobacteria bacterium]